MCKKKHGEFISAAATRAVREKVAARGELEV